MPEDIAVIRNNELVYTDDKEETINVLITKTHRYRQ